MNDPSPTQQPRRRRRWRWLAGISVGTLLFLALLPLVVSHPSVYQRMANRLVSDVAGELRINRVHIRWWKPIVAEGVRFADPQDRPVVEANKLSCDRSLLRLLTDRSSFGTIRLSSPHIYLLLDGPTSNIGEAVRPKSELEFLREGMDQLRKLDLHAAGELYVDDGQFIFQADPKMPRLDVGRFQMHASVAPDLGPENPRRLLLHPGILLDNTELTRELSRDLVSYVAPTLANCGWVEGSFSLHGDGGVFPLTDMNQATMKGRLVVHNVSAGPGPIVTAIAKVLQLKDEVRLVDDSEIEFEMANQQVHHHGLKFQIDQLTMETEGTVFFDQTIDIRIRIHFPETPQREGPLAKQLAGREIRLPVTGTMSEPRLDWKSAMEEHPFIDDLLDRVINPDETPVLDLLRGLRERRRKRKEQ